MDYPAGDLILRGAGSDGGNRAACGCSTSFLFLFTGLLLIVTGQIQDKEGGSQETLTYLGIAFILSGVFHFFYFLFKTRHTREDEIDVEGELHGIRGGSERIFTISGNPNAPGTPKPPPYSVAVEDPPPSYEEAVLPHMDDSDSPAVDQMENSSSVT
ncbi:unnamed protein product [Darwinula stevensoni]|uniref:Transmembrane protein n=1 Tax=Darwinula stevensoni TaxID=69355 RepID=A0A7R8XH40_9CRUS|nr:unnamed protein product [Darwinula stevensoni]CAG0892119.1 unnamed protein product [Darwinula stevensoni]